jgi:hypothetical protein
VIFFIIMTPPPPPPPTVIQSLYCEGILSYMHLNVLKIPAHCIRKYSDYLSRLFKGRLLLDKKFGDMLSHLIYSNYNIIGGSFFNLYMLEEL